MHLLVLARVLFIGSDHVLGCEAAQDSDPSMQRSRGLEGSGFRVQRFPRPVSGTSVNEETGS